MSPNLLHLTPDGSCTWSITSRCLLSIHAVLFLICTLPLRMLSREKQLSVSVSCGQSSKWNCPPCGAWSSDSTRIVDPAVYVATITPLSKMPPWLASRFPAASPHLPQVEYWRSCLTLALKRNKSAGLSFLRRFYIVSLIPTTKHLDYPTWKIEEIITDALSLCLIFLIVNLCSECYKKGYCKETNIMLQTNKAVMCQTHVLGVG